MFWDLIHKMSDKEGDKGLTLGSIWESLGRGGWKTNVLLVDRWRNIEGEGQWYVKPIFYFQEPRWEEEKGTPELKGEETRQFIK